VAILAARVVCAQRSLPHRGHTQRVCRCHCSPAHCGYSARALGIWCTCGGWAWWAECARVRGAWGYRCGRAGPGTCRLHAKQGLVLPVLALTPSPWSFPCLHAGLLYLCFLPQGFAHLHAGWHCMGWAMRPVLGFGPSAWLAPGLEPCFTAVYGCHCCHCVLSVLLSKNDFDFGVSLHDASLELTASPLAVSRRISCQRDNLRAYL